MSDQAKSETEQSGKARDQKVMDDKELDALEAKREKENIRRRWGPKGPSPADRERMLANRAIAEVRLAKLIQLTKEGKFYCPAPGQTAAANAQAVDAQVGEGARNADQQT